MDAELRTGDMRIILEDDDVSKIFAKQQLRGTLVIRAAANGMTIDKAQLELKVSPTLGTEKRFGLLGFVQQKNTYSLIIASEACRELIEKGFFNDYYAGDRYNIVLYLRSFLADS